MNSLIKAAENGDLEGIKRALEGGEDVNVRGIHGWTALIWASWLGHMEIVRLLLGKGADVDARGDKSGKTMILRELIEKGLREGMKRYNLQMKKSATLCAKDNMLIRAQLEAIQNELVNMKEGKDE